MKFPDFIIVGAMKCGTTALWRNLNNHPEITMGKNPEDPKKTSTEIRFWNNGGPHHTWNKGFDWYKSLFSGNCCGEKCANYIDKDETMKNISTHHRDCKIILCVRNPVIRAYSEFNMQLTTIPSKNKRQFSKTWKTNKRYQDRGKYFKMIQNRLLPYFPKEQIYVCIQERMYNNTNKELNKLYGFLETSPFKHKVEKVDFNERDKNLDNARKWKTEYKDMNPNLYKEIQEYYSKHNKNLFGFLGYEIKEWI